MDQLKDESDPKETDYEGLSKDLKETCKKIREGKFFEDCGLDYSVNDERLQKLVKAVIDTSIVGRIKDQLQVDNPHHVERETGETCVNCSVPVEVGQVVQVWDDETVHADCERPFRTGGHVKQEGPPLSVLLGDPMERIPLSNVLLPRSESQSEEPWELLKDLRKFVVTGAYADSVRKEALTRLDDSIKKHEDGKTGSQ